MFTWVCPQCGREVPPSKTECPYCAQQAASQPAAPQQTYAPPPAQAPPPPPQQYAPPPPHYYAAPPRAAVNLPVWLLTVMFAIGIGAVVGAIYWFLQSNRAQTGAGPTPTAAVESPAARPGGKVNPLQKYIEVSGVRFVTDAKKKTQARFVLINHSEADINGLAGNVTIWGRTKKSEEDAQGTFTFVTNLGPFESKELTVPLNTKLKIYELPDWQNITADVQITAPGP